MSHESPFLSILQLDPILADLPRKSESDVSDADTVIGASDWFPSEIVQAFRVLQESTYDISGLARSLSVVLALLRGELRTKVARDRWFMTGQIETMEGQTVHMATIGKLAREIVRTSDRLLDKRRLREEKAAQFRENSGKQQIQIGAALDRLEEAITSLEARRLRAATRFDQLLRVVADYLNVGA
jgi:hypothetical protein